jgi:hypothetical protein
MDWNQALETKWARHESALPVVLCGRLCQKMKLFRACEESESDHH